MERGIFIGVICGGEKYWRIAGNTGVWRNITVRIAEKYWRIAGNTGVWREILAYSGKYWRIARNTGV